MTTTAEKIKVMQAFDEWKTKGFDQPATIEKTPRAHSDWEDVGYEPQWNWEAFEYRIKPADPKPIECWVNTYNAGSPVHVFETKAEALRSAIDANSTYLRRGAVHMREVTPQDEQDREDAARYRKAFEVTSPYAIDLSNTGAC